MKQRLSNSIAQGFFEYGWLAPAVLPVLELLGRGVFNSFTALYVVWGFFVLPGPAFRSDKKIVLIFLLLIACFSFGLWGAYDVPRGIEAWGKYGFLCLTFFYTLLALRKNNENLHRLFAVLATVGIIVPALLILKTLVVTGGEQFVPAHQLLERNLPFLLPFVCLKLINLAPYKRSLPAWFFLLFSYLLIVVLSSGRAALLGLLAVLIVMLGVKFNKKTIIGGMLSVGVILIIAAGYSIGLDEKNGLSGSTFEIANHFSSGRLQLWQQALEYPPENILTGVGMGNVRYVDDVVTISTLVATDVKVRHLHNFLLDCWYETGVLGVTLLLLLFGCVICPATVKLLYAANPMRTYGIVLLAAFSGILAAGFFSFSYTSPQLSLYTYMLLGILYYLNESSLASNGERRNGRS